MVKQLSKINPHVKDWDNLLAKEEIIFLTESEMNSIIPEKKEGVVITFLKHPVRIKKDIQGPFERARLNMILASNDYIEVKHGGRAELMMSEGRVIRLDEVTGLRIGALTRDVQTRSVIGKFKLLLGRLWGKVFKTQLHRKKELYVATQTLVAGVRGTAYDMKLSPDHSTTIRVFEGEVELYNPLKKMPESGVIRDLKRPHRVSGPIRIKGPHRVTEKEWNEILLRQYQQVTVTKEGISKPTSFDYEKERQTEWIRWNEERDLELGGKEIY